MTMSWPPVRNEGADLTKGPGSLRLSANSTTL
jgi:hypothetical protein